ncbi:glycosyltransferase [Vibrio sp. PNB22_3_1]|uniref:glycosyltransferase n=1 Tax=unclassified Vibrio TaxID=2614977 RepID=UPI00354EB49D
MNVTFITTYGKEYHDKVLPTIKTLPQPIRWYVDDVQYANEIKEQHNLDVEILLGEWDDFAIFEPNPFRYAGVNMVIYAMHHLISENLYDKAVYVDPDVINLGGVEELFEIDCNNYQVMCSNAGNWLEQTESPSYYGINGGVYLFNLVNLRLDVPLQFHEVLTARDDEQYFVSHNLNQGGHLTGKIGRFNTIYNFYIDDRFMDSAHYKQALKMLPKAKILHFMSPKWHDRKGIMANLYQKYFE